MSSSPRTWQRGPLAISTDPSLIPVDQLNSAFGSDELYWVPSYDLPTLHKIVDNSLCFAMYTQRSLDSDRPELIGFARVVTDFMTIAYMTDVYVLKEYRRGGNGTWMMSCIREDMQSRPHMRALLLVSGSERHDRFYANVLDAHPFEETHKTLEMKGPGAIP